MRLLDSMCALAVAVTMLVGCGDRELDVTTEPRVLEPESIGEQLVFVEATRNRAVMLGVGSPRPSADPRVVDLPTDNPVQRLRRQATGPNAEPELLILCQGHPADDEGPATPAELVVLQQSGIDRRYELSAGFDAMTQSDDGRYAIAFYDPSGSAAENRSLLFNPNQIDIIDLDGAGAPASLTLTSVGDVPRSIVFSPELDLGGPRQLAVVLMNSVVSVVDLSKPEASDKMVQLATDGREIGLQEVLFDVRENKIYLRGATADVYVLQLLAEEDGDFQVSLNQLGAGTPPQDMALTNIEVLSQDTAGELELAPRLLAVAGKALIIDADSSRITEIPLSAPASRILLFRGAAPGDPVERERALLYEPNTSSVGFLDLDNVEERKGRNLETLSLPTTYASLVELDSNVVLLLHSSGGLSLLDLVDRTISVISSRQNLTDATFDTTLDRLWLKPQGDERIGYVDVLVDPATGARDFRPNEVRLGSRIERMLPIPEGSPPRLVVTHPSRTGHVTVLDAEEPGDFAQAVSLEGFITAALLK